MHNASYIHLAAKESAVNIADVERDCWRLLFKAIPHPLRSWEMGRDWLATKLEPPPHRPSTRRIEPRVDVELDGHLGGAGMIAISSISFTGLRVCGDLDELAVGETVHLNLDVGRPVSLSGKVSWTDGVEAGIRVTDIDPDDERTLHALVCLRLIYQ